jgi:hypothetical protein
MERALVEYVKKYQGVEPPEKRGEEWADYATKTHINDNPAYYYNYAFATVFKFQLHDYIARQILHQPPQACNYAGNKEVGAWLNKILEKGGTEDWRKVLKGFGQAGVGMVLPPTRNELTIVRNVLSPHENELATHPNGLVIS